MSTFSNKKGFTLVELLAVIVVLAIISILAMRAILPTFSNAKKDGFAIEANEAISAGSDAISLTYIDFDIKNGGSYKNYSNGDMCFTLTNLVDLGLYTKDLTGYEGYVYAKKGQYAYKYRIWMHNSNYKITNAAKADANSNVLDWSSSDTTSWSCPSSAISGTW